MKQISENRIIYGDCEVYSPNNQLMFRCSEKKIKWYLDRNLAIKINDKSIKLTFLPNGLGNQGYGYGLLPINNICVSCGSDKYLSKHHIVPFCYRKYFPDSYKEHNFHDVVALCVDCHNKYERKADELKVFLSDKYNAPVKGEENKNYKSAKKFKKISSNILNFKSKIPKDKLSLLLTEIKSYLNKDIINDEDIYNLANSKVDPIIRTHGEIVISKLENLDDFILMWRKHFVTNCDCGILPEGWNLNFKIT